MTSCAEVFAQAAKVQGVLRVFGHPGGEIVDLIDACERAGVEFVLTGHEATAAFMAGTVGRLTGRPGLCMATLGPGACNLLLGVACAYLDRDPLVAVSARTSSDRESWSNKQNLPLNELFAPVTKRSYGLDGRNTEAIVTEAFQTAVAAPRAPVYLTVPSDIAAGEDRADGARPPSREPAAVDDRSFDRISSALSRARRPVAVVGTALDRLADSPAVRRFLSATGLPVVTLPQGKGIADEDSELFIGAVGTAVGDAALIADLLMRSDCLLGIGFDPVELGQSWHRGAPIHSLAAGATGFGDYAPLAECTGPLGELLGRLADDYVGESDWSAAELTHVREAVRAAMIPKHKSGAAGLSPYHVTRLLHEALPEDAVLATDVGAHKVMVTQAWRATRPDGFLVTNGLSAMGYGLPAALAAASLHPDRAVVAIVGDGGFGMTVQELETARRLGVAPLIVVFCDRSLSIIKVAQDERQLPHRGVDFEAVDWARVAEGFGVQGRTARRLSDVEAAVADWRAQRAPMVLAVEIDDSLYAGLTY